MRTRRTEDPVTRADLKAVETTILKTIQKIPAAPAAPAAPKTTWATVAAAAVTTATKAGNYPWTPRVIVPERRTREVIIHTQQQEEALAKRTPVQVTEAVNRAIGRGADRAIAARRLPSGDIIVTFTDDATKYTEDTKWVEAAFGEKAELKTREFAVLAKGIPVNRLRNIYNAADILPALQRYTPGVNRCRIQLPRLPTAPYAELVLHMNSVEAAKKLCDRGLVWEAQIFNAEPYNPEARVRRCFRCHGFGHISRYYKKQERYGHYAAATYTGGEQIYPEYGPNGRKRCVNCKGTYTA